ncbi:tautomerase family protein [Sphingomonas morindae]|uniref:Tautomerase family protein n=1 Tax=Sphingomonas morindae TaxID=1541170 RepID=A0ABY4XE03_9SPHN|nr:tautomerase family protein [Sphingomonas morindae]USI75172.1 tautomerase family protein [Sphingomonas morindae]
MPFTRITLLAGKSPAYLQAIAESLDRSLVESFDVPETDRFVAFHQLQPEELIFDRQYRGGPRSDDFIVFHITTGRTRTTEMRARFFQQLVARLAEAPGIRPEDVMIILANSTFDDWSFASGVQGSTPVDVSY